MAALPEAPQPTIAAIWAAYEANAETGFRDHLGYSQVGHNCERALWYGFRWSTRAKFAGRMLRLFETGHREEDRFVADLRSIGITVMDVDPDNGRQWRVVGSTGHDGGSMDAVAIGFPEAPKTYHLCEFKTHSNKSFVALQKKGVAESKPMHWAQMQAYMHLSGLRRAFYLAKNKDNDDLYAERIEYDAEAGARLEAKAARIVNSPVPPARMAETPEYFECRWCDHRAVCWEGAAPERHCRSCLHSTPIAGGEWTCAQRDEKRDGKAQRAGCSAHLYIPQLIPGEVLDADPEAGWVSYRMADGTEWKDGAA